MKRIDHFTSAALDLAYEKNISIEEAIEILYQKTIKLHDEFLNYNSNSVQIKKNNSTS